MRLPALLLLPLGCAILSVASPGITPGAAGPNVTPEAPVLNYTTAKHNILITGFSTNDNKKEIIIDTLRLKLECYLVVDSKDVPVSVSWKHGEEQISSELYTYNNTDNQWDTTYEFVVTDANKTGDYTCTFSSSANLSGTFTLQVPPVHGGSKAVVSYIGDSIVLKCDASTYKPQRWLWYKVKENELVLLNLSSDPQKYEERSKKDNETKLHITGLSESDSGGYVCKAIFHNVESEGQVQITVLSYLVPLKVFFVIAAEVVILVTVILVCEIMNKKKQGQEDDKKEYEPMRQLKSEDSSIAEANSTRQRKA